MTRYPIPLTVALLTAWPAPEAGGRTRAKSPVSPLAKVGALLQRGGNAAVMGRTRLAGTTLRLAVPTRTLTALKQAGVRRVQLVGFEFELIYYQGPSASYYLRTFVHTRGQRVALMGLSGRKPSRGKVWVSGVKPSALPRVLAGFRAAARRFTRANIQRACLQVPVISKADVKRFGVVGRLAKRLQRDRRRVLKNRAAVCRDLATVRRHRQHVRIDDVAFVARGRGGKLVGLVRSDLRLRGNRATLRLGRFKALRP